MPCNRLNNKQRSQHRRQKAPCGPLYAAVIDAPTSSGKAEGYDKKTSAYCPLRGSIVLISQVMYFASGTRA